MNSLRMYVEDAIGCKFLFTLASNREGQEKSFRNHATWWIKKGYRYSKVEFQPAHPCRIIVEPYQDQTAPR